jgi:hypothetical protein
MTQTPGAGTANGNGIITDGLVSGVADSSDPRWGGDGGGGVNGRGAGFQDIDLGGLSQVDVSWRPPCFAASLHWYQVHDSRTLGNVHLRGRLFSRCSIWYIRLQPGQCCCLRGTHKWGLAVFKRCGGLCCRLCDGSRVASAAQIKREQSQGSERGENGEEPVSPTDPNVHPPLNQSVVWGPLVRA